MKSVQVVIPTEHDLYFVIYIKRFGLDPTSPVGFEFVWFIKIIFGFLYLMIHLHACKNASTDNNLLGDDGSYAPFIAWSSQCRRSLSESLLFFFPLWMPVLYQPKLSIEQQHTRYSYWSNWLHHNNNNKKRKWLKQCCGFTGRSTGFLKIWQCGIACFDSNIYHWTKLYL